MGLLLTCLGRPLLCSNPSQYLVLVCALYSPCSVPSLAVRVQTVHAWNITITVVIEEVVRFLFLKLYTRSVSGLHLVHLCFLCCQQLDWF